MLKRNDLAKQFELIVQQEIKNFNDSMNLILDSLRDLKKGLFDLQEKTESRHAKLHSESEKNQSELARISKEMRDLNEKFESSARDQEVMNRDIELDTSCLTTDVLRLITDSMNANTSIDNLKKEMSSLHDQFKHARMVINDNLDDLSRRFREELAGCKKEILEAPTEAQKVKTDLEKKLSCHVVDVDGIMKELRIYKHDNMVTQKKIEHLYTLVERLKK